MSSELAQRRVVCAANRFNGQIVLGARHFDKRMHEAIAALQEAILPIRRLPECPSEWEQGFIDQFGEFMTREEAWIVAEAARQIIRRVGGDGVKLFSENLY